MENGQHILSQLQEIKSILAAMVGTGRLQTQDQFSIEAIDRVAKQFQKLAIERGDWVDDYDISKVIKHAPFRVGSFLITEFNFKNYFKKGHTTYFYKPDLIALNAELKKRNVDLARYVELRDSQKKFSSYVDKVLSGKAKRSDIPFKIGRSVKDVEKTETLLPPIELVKEDIKKLRKEFFENQFEKYIDIYKNNHAMPKHMVYFDRYMDKAVAKHVRKWCSDFNFAHEVHRRITKKRPDEFIPVKEEDMIEL